MRRHAAPRPTGVFHLRPLAGVGSTLMIENIVATVAELEARRLAIRRVLQVAAEIAHLALRLLVDADQLHLAGDRIAAILKIEHRRHDDRGGHPFDVVADHLADLLFMPAGVGEAVETAGLEHHVGDDAVDAVLHLARKTFHHAVDDNHHRHAEHHADDRRQGDVSRAKVPPAKQKLVHGGRGVRGQGLEIRD